MSWPRLSQEAKACKFCNLLNINKGLALLELANTVLILINTDPSNFKTLKYQIIVRYREYVWGNMQRYELWERHSLKKKTLGQHFQFLDFCLSGRCTRETKDTQGCKDWCERNFGKKSQCATMKQQLPIRTILYLIYSFNNLLT